MEKDARGSQEDNMKPTMQCAAAAAVRAYWAAMGEIMAYDLYSEIEINQKDRKERIQICFLFFTYSIKLPSPAPFSMGNTFQDSSTLL